MYRSVWHIRVLFFLTCLVAWPKQTFHPVPSNLWCPGNILCKRRNHANCGATGHTYQFSYPPVFFSKVQTPGDDKQRLTFPSHDPKTLLNNIELKMHSERCGPAKICIFTVSDSEVILSSICVCLSRWLSGWFHYEGVVPHPQYISGT